MTSTAALFASLKIGSFNLKNRIVMSAMTRNRAVPTNVPNKYMVEYYKQRSGAGLIVSEGILTSPQGSEWPNSPGIWSKEQVETWKPVVSAVHGDGTPIVAQLWHLGRTAHPDMPEHKASGQPVYGPSAIAAAGGKFRQLDGEPGYITPTPIDDPFELVTEFKQAALNAKEAGFDGVEAHGASGYLIHQFLDSSANQRTDEWGGSPEKRSKFGLEVLKALISVFGATRVGIKLQPAGGVNDLGMPLEETLATYRYFVTEASKLGIAYIAFFRHYPMVDPTGRGTEHDVIATYGPLVSAPTVVIGNAGFQPAEAATAISEGKIGAVAFGFMYVANPDLAKRIQHNKEITFGVDFPSLYTTDGSEDSVKKGYTDYPEAEY